ncbi:hypothetical protein BD769DRAFT_1670767 [Suillus cothurnatus]|nr:hypothetical protein BD769DRAFT_1670767 [Suillus cothurnatus]
MSPQLSPHHNLTDMLCVAAEGDTMQSPFKAKAAAMAGGPPGDEGGGSSTVGNRDDLLAALPDPLGQYAGLIAQYRLQNTVVVAPAVRDGNSAIM